MPFFSDISRISQIAGAFAKEGMGWFVKSIGLGIHIPFTKKVFSPAEAPKRAWPERLRRIFEELGGAYVKLGQFLALRPDLIPWEYCEEFKKLQDNVKPVAIKDIREMIKFEFGKPLESVFSDFDENSIGSASVAQAHIAKLKDGTRVVVKVQRPNAVKKFRADIELMYHIAERMARSEKFAEYNPIGVVQEFEKYTKKELDFTIEAKNIEWFYRAFKSSKTVKIPRVFWDYTTQKVIVLEYIDGKKLTTITGKEFDKKKLAKVIVNAMLAQAFEAELFHGDLHPGNLLALPNNRIGILDFGIIGSLDKELRKLGIELYSAMMDKNTEEIVRIILRIGCASPETNLEEFKRDVRDVMGEWHGATMKDVRFTSIGRRLFDACIRHKIKMPADLFLLAKAMLTVEGTCLFLDPNFDFVGETRAYFKIVLKKEFKKKFSKEYIVKRAVEAKDYLGEFSQGMLAIMEKIKKGPIEISMTDTDIKHLGMDIGMGSNRLSYAIVIGTLLVTGALLIGTGPKYHEVSYYSLAAFSAVLLLTLSLMVSIMKEGNKKFDYHKEFN